ncbi:hypothetical protein KC19_3G216600 [Ceratodon purpureus]|uniref:Uncharacterized protein n=1 Tax=Ceratodon purpureus TaxID=3225 RepID=A0A8T0INH9_CERPU|nr:hypothetical protein KC19_3G216600 [Ceratodon purpureus]
MEVVDGLGAVRAIVDNKPEALVELLLAGDLGGRDHEVAEDLLVAVVGLGELREAVAHLGDEHNVRGALRRDVAEREHGVVLEDDLGGDLLGDDLVEDGGLPGVRPLLGVRGGGLARGPLLVRHGGGQVRLQNGDSMRQRKTDTTTTTTRERERDAKTKHTRNISLLGPLHIAFRCGNLDVEEWQYICCMPRHLSYKRSGW